MLMILNLMLSLVPYPNILYIYIYVCIYVNMYIKISFVLEDDIIYPNPESHASTHPTNHPRCYIFLE